MKQISDRLGEAEVLDASATLTHMTGIVGRETRGDSKPKTLMQCVNSTGGSGCLLPGGSANLSSVG
jgi:hypothetical protein